MGGGISQGRLRGKPGEKRENLGRPGGHPQAAAVGQVETITVGVRRDVVEEDSVDEEDLLGLVKF